MKNKLQIFKVVANHLSFTKAAKQLYISQPAVSKTIKKLEEEYKTTLFLRKRNSIELTPEGTSFLVYAIKVLDVYSEMEDQFVNKKTTFPSLIKFGASTTLVNYIIPNVIAQFLQQFPGTRFNIKGGNSEFIKKSILNQEFDFGITEGENTNPKLHFRKFIKDEIVLVTSATNNAFGSGLINADKIEEIPMVVRELGSGTKEVIESYLSIQKIKRRNKVVTLNSNEAIKNYLSHSDHYAFVSIHAVIDDLTNNKLKVIDIKDFAIERWFYFVSRTGYHSRVMNYLEKYIRSNHNF